MQTWSGLLLQSYPVPNVPLLGIRYPRRVQPIGELIGRPCRVMAHQPDGEVLWDACTLTLSSGSHADEMSPINGLILWYYQYIWFFSGKFCSHTDIRSSHFSKGSLRSIFRRVSHGLNRELYWYCTVVEPARKLSRPNSSPYIAKSELPA